MPFSVGVARRVEPVEDLDRFEPDLHRLFVMAEREALGHELARFDLDVPQVEIAGDALPPRTEM